MAWFLSSGKTIAEVASALNLPEPTVRTWLEQAAAAASGKTPLEHGTGEAVKSLDESTFVLETADFIPESPSPSSYPKRHLRPSGLIAKRSLDLT